MRDLRKEFEANWKTYDAQLKNECANCGATDNLHIHHVVPLALGGTNRISNLVKLCTACHSKIHGVNLTKAKILQRAGIERAKREGKYNGRPKTYTDDNPKVQEAINMYMNRSKNGLTVRKISEITGISEATLYRAVRRLKKAQ
jgi:hypothetical protein